MGCLDTMGITGNATAPGLPKAGTQILPAAPSGAGAASRTWVCASTCPIAHVGEAEISQECCLGWDSWGRSCLAL